MRCINTLQVSVFISKAHSAQCSFFPVSALLQTEDCFGVEYVCKYNVLTDFVSFE